MNNNIGDNAYEEYDDISLLIYLNNKLNMNYIARDLSGNIMVYKDMPIKSSNRWYTNGVLYIDKFPLVADYEFAKNIHWEDNLPFNIREYINNQI